MQSPGFNYTNTNCTSSLPPFYVYSHSCRRDKSCAQHFKGIELKWQSLVWTNQPTKEKKATRCQWSASTRDASPVQYVASVLCSWESVNKSKPAWIRFHMHWVSQSGSPYMQVLCYEWASGLLTQYSLTAISMFAMNIWKRLKLCTSAIYNLLSL